MMTLSSFLTKFRSWEANWSKQSRTRNILWGYQSEDWKWPWLVGFERFERCWPLWPLWGICYTSCLPNLATKRWIVLLSGTLFLPKSLLLCHCVRRTDFVAKYTSMIFIGCCVVNRPVGSILVSKESPRPAVHTTWKIWKQIVKQNFEMKNKIGRFWTARGWQLAGSFPTSL